VLLNVNVGFLAIQSVDNGAGQSLSQIASYVSVISSFGSMLLGVKLARQSHVQGPNMVDNAVRVLRMSSLIAVSNNDVD
jgi:predicted Co/Zn/Cd cation transporter (cation efflux family)